MHLGTRQIRTSGKGSGSIELTLPSELRDLVGLPCRVLLRDGSRPEIVLQPDLGRAIAGFTGIWQPMVAALLPERGEQSLRLAAFTFGLQPGGMSADRPYLCWRDGLALGAAPPHDPLTAARTIAAFGQVLADGFHIAPSFAAAFGAAAGLLATGTLPRTDLQEICDVVAGALPPPLRLACTASLLADPEGTGAAGAAFWERAAAPIAAAAELFHRWTADPSELATLRCAWQRGFSIEMSEG